MPRTTHAYPFEAKVGDFADRLCRRFTTGSALRSFLLVLDETGDVRSLTIEDGSADWHGRCDLLRKAGTPHLFYDPLEDGLEYIWLSWERIERSTMERLLGQRFEASDFTPFLDRSLARALEPANAFPGSWGVMF